MQIRVRHETKYVYSAPLSRSTQYLRITPRHDDGQSVSGWRVTAPGKLSEWQDHHHNICHTLVVDQPVEQLSVVGEGLVETTETYGVSPAMPYDLPTAIYLRQTDFTRPDARLRRFADKFRRAVADDMVKGLHALMLGVREAVDYQENETHVHTTAAEALADGAGVCQDHAHVFISACRILDVPARYVGGYLASTDDPVEHAAGHAWASALVPDLGWVSFDPANAVSATERYVYATQGLDYADVSPVRGVRHGGGNETLSVAIKLQATAAAQQQ
jgi:transglutaminase-like putative cysteine protease